LAWASLGTLTTAQASGRLGAVVAHILLPLVAAGIVCATRRSTHASVTFGTALAMAVLGAFNPALAVLAAFAALVLIVVGHGATRLHALVLLLVPAGLLGPWILRLVADPLLLLGGPGLARWHDETSAPWQLALLHPGGPGSYPVLLSVPHRPGGCRRHDAARQGLPSDDRACASRGGRHGTWRGVTPRHHPR